MISRIKKDKLLHFIIGTYIMLVAQIFIAMPLALLAVAVVGLAKEVLYDLLLKKGTPERADFVYTLLGGVLTYLILLA